MGKGKGFGKTILFGEHFVVYGLPAIASALADITTAEVEKAEEKGLHFIDERPATPGYKEKKKEEIQRQLDALIEHFKIDTGKEGTRIRLAGNLTCASGVGASAALAASIARALNKMLGLNMNDDQINEAAYIAEKAGTGTPSGIDNTCSVYGGFILFEKNLTGGPNKIERLSVKEPAEIVLANTGITQETKVVVGDVRKKKEADEAWFGKVCEEYKEMFDKALEGLKNGDWKTVGEQMDRNQELLQEIGVSCKEIEEIVKAAKENGAFGAKLTGTGRGGYVLLLTPGKELQEKVANAVKDKGYATFRTKIGGE